MAEVSYFSGYSQEENRITNYALLVLKVIYEESPRLFQEFITGLLAEQGKNINVGVEFKQQQGYTSSRKSIIDGVIEQQSFKIFVEVKKSDWNYSEQMERHIQNLRTCEDCKNKILLLLANFDGKANEEIKKLQQEYEEIIIQEVEFEDFLRALKELEIKNDIISQMIDQFEQFLSEQNLLPTWKYRLDVVNSAQSFDFVMNHHIYICPEAKGSYAHARSKYFGVYSNKKVDAIAEISALCASDEDGTITVSWCNDGNIANKEIISIVQKKLDETDRNWHPMQIFLLKDIRQNINFQKDTSGGMFGHKKYFNFDSEVKNIDDLMQKIRNTKWTDHNN